MDTVEERTDVSERMAVALERIAERVNGPSEAIVARVETLERLLEAFVCVMENLHSTDEDWRELLAAVREALDQP